MMHKGITQLAKVGVVGVKEGEINFGYTAGYYGLRYYCVRFRFYVFIVTSDTKT